MLKDYQGNNLLLNDLVVVDFTGVESKNTNHRSIGKIVTGYSFNYESNDYFVQTKNPGTGEVNFLSAEEWKENIQKIDISFDEDVFSLYI